MNKFGAIFKHFLLICLLIAGALGGMRVILSWLEPEKAPVINVTKQVDFEEQEETIEDKQPISQAVSSVLPTITYYDIRSDIKDFIDLAKVDELPIVEPKINDYDSTTFETTFVRTKDSQELRQLTFSNIASGKLSIQIHKGGEILEHEKIVDTINYVISTMPNIQANDNLTSLVLETFITETHLGSANYERAIRRFKNYGIGQFRVNVAEDTLKWLGWVRKDVKEAVMQYYDDKHDMAYNLTYNVPFAIAMCVQYYWRRIPDLNKNIETITQRAIAWKVQYNTRYGLGTVNKYRQRVDTYFTALNTNKGL